MAARYPEDCETGRDEDIIQHVSGLPKDVEFVSECEVIIEGEIEGEIEGDELDTRHKCCIKNPGHLNFIPVSEFSMKNLPKELQTEENMDLIQKKIDRTVRIRVAYTSTNRPDVFSDSKASYPFSKYRGNKRVVRYGTGSINRLLSSEPLKDKPCPCHLCVKSDNPMKEYYLITISTATHVIYDDSEAEKATIDCFFDSVDSEGVKTLYGYCVDGSNTSHDSMYKSDVCEVVCVTHDSETVKTILGVTSPNALNLPHWYSTTLPPEGVIVSHPHGCSKRITFGQVLHLTVPVKPRYETCTPIVLPEGTKCHISSNNSDKELSGESFASLTSFLNRRSNMNCLVSDGLKLKGEEEASQNPLMSILENLFQSAIVDAPSPRKNNAIDDQLEHVSNSKNDERKKTVKGAYSELYDECIKRNATASEFSHSSFDTVTSMKLIRDNLKDSEVPLQMMPLKMIDCILPGLNSSIQTSNQCSDNGFNMKEPSPSMKEDSIDLFTEIVDAYGLNDEFVVPILESLKETVPTMLDQTLSHNQQQSLFEELFGNVFQQGFAIGVEKSLNSKNNSTNDVTGDVSYHADNEVCNESYEDDDSSEDGDINDAVQSTMQKTLEGLDVQTQTTLKHFGLEEMLKSMVEAFDDSNPLGCNMSQTDRQNSIVIPSRVKFILPSDAIYAMRYYKESRGRFTFPSGTKIINAVGESMILPDGLEFQNETFHPQHAKIFYDIDTCPGSSGAAVYSNLLDNELMTFFPHSGSGGELNLSGLQENKLFPVKSHIFHVMNNIVHQITDLDLD